MAKSFFRNISKNFCVYLLTIANIIHALDNDAFDWLLWLSIALSGISVVLCAIAARGGDTHD